MKPDCLRVFPLIHGFGQDAFHSAVLTSYTFNGGYFEGACLPELLKSGISSINVLVDASCFEATIGIGTVSTSRLGSRYALDTVHSSGAFHPKLNFFIGRESALLIFGSGNLTAGGQGKNIELFSAIYAQADMPGSCELIAEAWQYLCSFADRLSPYSRARILSEIGAQAPLLAAYEPASHSFRTIAPGVEAAFLYNDSRSSISAQLSSLIAADIREAAVDLCITSPFFDSDGAFLQRLRSIFPNARMRVVFASDSSFAAGAFTRFPSSIPEPGAYSFHTIKGGLASRPLHAKSILIRTPDSDYCLIGSTNATLAAFGGSSRAVNDEFAVLYKAGRSKRDFEAELGLQLSRAISFGSIIEKKKAHPDPTATPTSAPTVVLCAAELSGRTLKLSIDEIPEHSEVLCLDCEGSTIARYPLGGDSVVIDAPGTTFIRISTPRGTSNTVPLLNLDSLFFTHPAKANRTYTKLLLELERENPAWNKLDSTICQIISELADDKLEVKTASAGGNSRGSSQKDVVQGDYDAYFDEHGAPDDPLSAPRIGRTVGAIVDAFKKALTADIESRRDSSADQEEDPDAAGGREYTARAGKPADISPLKVCANLIGALLKAYTKRLKAGSQFVPEVELKKFYGTMGLISQIASMPLERESGHTSAAWEERLRRFRSELGCRIWPTIDLFAKKYRRKLTPDAAAALLGLIATSRQGISETIDQCIMHHGVSLKALLPPNAGKAVGDAIAELYADSSTARAAARIYERWNCSFNR
ncbi:MAG: hypothetical protein NC418_10580 [Muribaculaceae bacterium]|nr:hypothetical protein [Muribaculaceae bacterium]